MNPTLQQGRPPTATKPIQFLAKPVGKSRKMKVFDPRSNGKVLIKQIIVPVGIEKDEMINIDIPINIANEILQWENELIQYFGRNSIELKLNPPIPDPTLKSMSTKQRSKLISNYGPEGKSKIWNEEKQKFVHPLMPPDPYLTSTEKVREWLHKSYTEMRRIKDVLWDPIKKEINKTGKNQRKREPNRIYQIKKRLTNILQRAIDGPQPRTDEYRKAMKMKISGGQKKKKAFMEKMREQFLKSTGRTLRTRKAGINYSDTKRINYSDTKPPASKKLKTTTTTTSSSSPEQEDSGSGGGKTAPTAGTAAASNSGTTTTATIEEAASPKYDIGTVVYKLCDDETKTVLFGEIMDYDADTNLYLIRYDDGGDEDDDELEMLDEDSVLSLIQPPKYMAEDSNAAGPVLLLGMKYTHVFGGYNYTLNPLMDMVDAGYTERRMSDQARISGVLSLMKEMGVNPLAFALSLDDAKKGKNANSDDECLWVNELRQIFASWNDTSHVMKEVDQKLDDTANKWDHCWEFYQIILDWYWFQQGWFNIGRDDGNGESIFKTLLEFHKYLFPGVGCVYLPFQVDLLRGIAIHEAEFNKKYDISFVNGNDAKEMEKNILYKSTKTLDDIGFLTKWCGVKEQTDTVTGRKGGHLDVYCYVQPNQLTAQVSGLLKKYNIDGGNVKEFKFIKLQAKKL